VRAAVLPNYAQCLDVGKQTIAAQLGYISGAVPHRPAHTGSRSRSVAVLAHGHATTTSTTPSADGRGLGGFADGSVPPCPSEIVDATSHPNLPSQPQGNHRPLTGTNHECYL